VRERTREGHGGEVEERLAEVDSGIGCCMMYRREAALAAGGYDRAYSPVWFDDVDLCLGIRKLGGKVFYLPDVRVIHHFVGRRAPEGGLARLGPKRVGRAILRRTGGRLPQPAQRAIETRWAIDLWAHFRRPQVKMIRHHIGYWREKWGWDPRNPDMDAIERRWGDTEICWASDPERRAAGERIVGAWEAASRAYAAPSA
jgi:hypothetical protein